MDIKNEIENPIELANEFTLVRVGLVSTGGGARLRIESPRLGHRVDLDPLELEALAWQEPGFFSALLTTPLGPSTGMRIGNLSELINPAAGNERGDV